MIEGPQKLAILNQITYMVHMNSHPSGIRYHPEVLQVIENVHYLVNNNLPVNRYVINNYNLEIV